MSNNSNEQWCKYKSDTRGRCCSLDRWKAFCVIVENHKNDSCNILDYIDSIKKASDHFLNASLSGEDSLQVPFSSPKSPLPSDRFILIMRFNEQLQNHSKVKFERKQSGCSKK